MTRRILIAEDEMITAFDLCNTVEEAGFMVAGPYARNSSAMTAFENAKPDLAILDVDLYDGDVFMLAQRIVDDDIPIIFHCDERPPDEIAERFPQATTMTKPCPPDQVLETVSQVLSDSEKARE